MGIIQWYIVYKWISCYTSDGRNYKTPIMIHIYKEKGKEVMLVKD